MTDFDIIDLRPVLAFDSRGTPTVSCEVTLSGGGRGTATVPSGASTGTHEAVEVRDGGDAYAGRGVDQAVRNVAGEIADIIRGMAVSGPEGLRAVDDALRELDGTPALSRLGGNAVLAVSIATALASADQAHVEPYEWFADGAPVELPMPMINIFSGGAHAATGLDVQDLLIVPIAATSIEQAMRWCWEVRRAVGALLESSGYDAQLVADEGGFGVPLPNTRAGFSLLVDGIEAAGLRPGIDVAIAVDVAANELVDADGYVLGSEGRRLTSTALVAEVASWCAEFPIVSIEDPVAEDDMVGWREATLAMPNVQLLGDDLFVTSSERLLAGIGDEIASAVLVKPNQNGTVSGADDVTRLARQHGYSTVLSARSGETEDAWLADLAVGWSTGQIKVGSLTRSERTAKWNRLLRISDRLEGAAFADAGVIRTPRDVRPTRDGSS